jgi:hypothetical protein
LALPIGTIVLDLGHVELQPVHHLVLEEDDGVGIADRRLHQALGVGGVIGRHDLQARDLGVPGRIVLAVLGADAAGGAVRAAEHDSRADLAARHVERLGGRVDDVVDGLHGEVERHELDDRLQARHRCPDAEAGEAVLGDRGVHDTLVAELLQQLAADLVGALILGDFLADQEDAVVAAHLLGHGVTQGVADGRLHQLGVGRDFGSRSSVLGAAAAGAAAFSSSPEDSAGAASALGAPALGAGAAAPSSPARRAIGVLTFTFSEPSGTRISSTSPSSTASTSIVALSVSISAIT